MADGYLKPATSDWITSVQPSTSTNSNNLNGSDIIAGGSMDDDASVDDVWLAIFSP